MKEHEIFQQARLGTGIEKQYIQITKSVDYDASFCVNGKEVSFVVYEEGSKIYEEEVTREELKFLIEELKKVLTMIEE